MSGFQLHPQAYADLDSIWEFIALESQDSADRVIGTIYDAVQALVAHPYQGHHRPDLTNRPLRFVRCYDYLIAYAPDEHPLWIAAVIHGRRHPGAFAHVLEERH